MAFRQRLTPTCMQDDRPPRRPFVVPANPHRPSSAPPGGLRQRALHGNGRLSPSLTRLSLPTRNIRTAHSLPPATKGVGALRGRDIPFYSRPSTPRRQNSPMTSGATNGVTRSASARTSETEVFGRRPRVRSEEDVSVASQGMSSPLSAERDFWPPREESMEPTAGMSMPGRFMEVVEDRDRAVHMCLQYRSKLRGTEKRLRDAEHRAFDLARQLGEAAAAEAATRKMLDRAMEKARVEADRAHNLQTSRCRYGNGTSQPSTFDDSKKTRLQLARARRDLRELWLERDELAVMASQAMQAESDGRERIKKLELVVQGLQERITSMKNVERGMAEEIAEVEAKAASAVKAKHELNSKVVEIKSDFEVLAQDLRQRDRTVQRLETENANLAAEIASRKANRVDVPPDPPHQGERRVAWRTAGQDRSTQISYGPEYLVRSANQNETESGVETHQALSERGRAVIVEEPVENAPDVVASPVREWKNHLDVRKAERSVHDSSLPEEQADMVQARGEHPGAGSSRMLNRQLNPEASALPGRVKTTPSFPMKGVPEVLNRQLAESATPEKRVDVGPASNEEKTSEPLSRDLHESGRELLRRPPPPMPSLPSPPHRTAGDTGELSVSPSLVASQHCRTRGSIQPPRRQQTNPNNFAQEMDGDRRRNLFAERVDEFEFLEGRNANNRLDVRETGEDRRGSSFDSVAYVKRKPKSIADISMPPLSTRLERLESYSNVFVPRLLEGIPVLKHSVKGKPKEKTLWVTPDLSEIYYTAVGRTRNSKQTSRMPLAELRAERGRDREHPNLSTNLSIDNQRFFSLVRIHGESRAEASAGRSGSLMELHSSSSDDDRRERHYLTGDRSTSRRLTGVSGSPAGKTSRRSSLPFGSGTRVRERMSFEMASGEERDAIVEEINRLARGKITRSSPEIFASQRGP